MVIEAMRNGFNLGHEPYRPSGSPWVSASTHGYQTEYLRYAQRCPDNVLDVDLRDADLQRHVVTRADGSIFVDESLIMQNQSIPSQASFESVNVAKMYRNATDHVPFYYANFFESVVLTFDGPALADLQITVRHPGLDRRAPPVEWKVTSPDAYSPVSRKFGRVTPGQTTLVAWSPAVR